jgi:hypothetical protein
MFSYLREKSEKLNSIVDGAAQYIEDVAINFHDDRENESELSSSERIQNIIN